LVRKIEVDGAQCRNGQVELKLQQRSDVAADEGPVTADGVATRWYHDNGTTLRRGAPDGRMSIEGQFAKSESHRRQGNRECAGRGVDEFEGKNAVTETRCLEPRRVAGPLDPRGSWSLCLAGDRVDQGLVRRPFDRFPRAWWPVVCPGIQDGPCRVWRLVCGGGLRECLARRGHEPGGDRGPGDCHPSTPDSVTGATSSERASRR